MKTIYESVDDGDDDDGGNDDEGDIVSSQIIARHHTHTSSHAREHAVARTRFHFPPFIFSLSMARDNEPESRLKIARACTRVYIAILDSLAC